MHIYDPKVKEDQIIRDLSSLWRSRGLSEPRIKQLIRLCIIYTSAQEAIVNTSALAIITEWDEFKIYDWPSLIEKMAAPSMIFDGRNILSELKTIDHLYSIGKPG